MISGIANGLYEDGGFGYIQDTNFHYYAIAGKSDFYLDDALRAQKLECVDYQVLCKIFSNYVGVPAKRSGSTTGRAYLALNRKFGPITLRWQVRTRETFAPTWMLQWNAPKSLNVKARDLLYQPEGQPFGSAQGVEASVTTGHK